MNSSLQNRLSVMLSSAIIIVGLLAAGVAFVSAYNEAHEFQDETLRQIAGFAPADVAVAMQRRDSEADEDPEARIIVQRVVGNDPNTLALPSQPAQLLRLPTTLNAGFHTLEIHGTPWRVFIHTSAPGVTIAVAQSTEVRRDAARDSASRTLIPLLILIPFLVVLSRRLVKASLGPVRALAEYADAQAVQHPSALPLHQVPDEVVPFVRAINRLLERTNDAMAQQRRFVADAAHELRSPLTALSLQLENVARSESLATCKERIAPLRSGLARSRRLLDQLLSLARAQASSVDPRPLDLRSVAQSVVEELSPIAAGKQIDLGLEQTDEAQIDAESEAMHILLRNALDNALRSSPQGGIVTVRVHVADGDAVVEVVDQGPGIAQEDREQVFAAFYRARGSPIGGSGLGLAIVRSIADRFGGKATLAARSDGPGLVFTYRQRLAGPTTLRSQFD